MHKLLLSTLLALSTTSFCHDPIQEAILNSDYEAVAQQYNAQEIPENLQRAYCSIADDTAQMRSNNFAFDWAKALVSKKLLISIFFLYGFDGAYKIFIRHKSFIMEAGLCAMGCFTSIAFFASALADGNKYYNQLQDKIKDAERIKFLIMNRYLIRTSQLPH